MRLVHAVREATAFLSVCVARIVPFESEDVAVKSRIAAQRSVFVFVIMSNATLLFASTALGKAQSKTTVIIIRY